MRGLNQHLQDGILRLAITDEQFLRAIRPALLPKHMTSRVGDAFLRICYGYADVAGEAPNGHFHDELVRVLDGRSDEEQAEWAEYARKIQEMDDPNREYVLSRVHRFVQMRVREDALLRASEALAAGDLETHDALMYDALKAGVPSQDAGLDWLADDSSLWRADADDGYLMTTGIKALDRLIGGYRRGWLVTTLGGYKAGKSWQLLHVCFHAMRSGLRALYVSHELSQDQAELRLDMMATRMATEKHAGQPVEYYVAVGDGLERRSKTPANILDHPHRRAKARKALARCGGGLRVKKYPMGQCTPGEVVRHLEYLEAFERWTPDVVVIDYLDIMDLSGLADETRHRLDAGYRWAKGLADERNVLVATVSQVQRSALRRRWVYAEHVSEDARKCGNVDLMLAIGRDPALASKRMATLNVVMAREDGQMNRGCVFSTVPEIGCFAASSWLGKDLDEQVDPLVEDTRDAKLREKQAAVGQD